MTVEPLLQGACGRRLGGWMGQFFWQAPASWNLAQKQSDSSSFDVVHQNILRFTKGHFTLPSSLCCFPRTFRFAPFSPENVVLSCQPRSIASLVKVSLNFQVRNTSFLSTRRGILFSFYRGSLELSCPDSLLTQTKTSCVHSKSSSAAAIEQWTPVKTSERNGFAEKVRLMP